MNDLVSKERQSREVDDFLAGAVSDCRLQQAFEWDGWCVVLHTNSQQLLDMLGDYYQHFKGAGEAPANLDLYAYAGAVPEFGFEWRENQPEPGKKNIKEAVALWPGGRVVRKVLTGVQLLYAGDQRLCAGPLLDNPNQVVNFLNNMYLEDLLKGTGQLFHAAGVCSGSAGVGLAGTSGKGKSTLALRLLGEGFDLVSNDRLVVKEHGDKILMQGIPKYPRINPGTIVNQPALTDIATPLNLARYRAMAADALWELEEKYDAFVESCFPGCRFRLAADMKMFVVIDWDRKLDQPFRLEPVVAADLGALVNTVMKSPGILLPRTRERIPMAQADDYLQLLGKTRLYRLAGGVDFDGAVSAIKAELASSISGKQGG